MIKQYIKQSIQMLKENRLVSVISIAVSYTHLTLPTN